MGLIRIGLMVTCLAASPLLFGQAANELPSLGQLGDDEYALEGAVVDSNGLAVRMARLTLASTSVPSGQTGFSDEEGRFFFYRLRPGSYVLTIAASGCESATQSVDLRYSSQRIHVVLQRREKADVPAGRAIVSAASLKITEEARKSYEKGQELLHRKKPKEAVKAFQSVIRQEPEFAPGYSALGIAYIQVQDFDRADESFQKALALDEMLGEAHLGLGLVENERKAYAQAERHLVQARGILPNDWRVYYELGRSLYHQDRLEEAEAALVQGRSMHSDYGNLRLLLANTYARQDRLSDALAEMQAFLKISPKSSLAPKVRQTVKALEKEIAQRQ